MEPANLNSPPPDDDARFDAWLRESAVADPLPDAGFSARVVAALPPRGKTNAWRRISLCVAGAVAAAVASRLDSGHWPTVATLIEPANTVEAAIRSLASAPWVGAIFALAALLASFAWALVFALREEDSRDGERSELPT